MLIEQAFHALPEILCGSRYPGQDYEGGVVIALTMAILQELNGRSVPNPLSCIKGEHLYQEGGFPQDGGLRNRPLRADLRVDIGDLRVASERLGTQYGWRHQNWVEAKFPRQGKITKSAATAGLLGDLVRLATLVPEQPNRLSANGRYLLHVYNRPPLEILSMRRNKNKNGPGGTRQWVKDVSTSGRHEESDLGNVAFEPDAILNGIGAQLGDLRIRLMMTNFSIEPTNPPDPPEPAASPLYWCFLTRIDGIRCEYAGSGFRLSTNRQFTETRPGDFERIRSEVARYLKQAAPTEETSPEDVGDAHGPATSFGASGFRSNMSWCGGPPTR